MEKARKEKVIEKLDNELFKGNDLEKLLKLRVSENKENFTEEQINTILDNLKVCVKVYSLGIADCVKVFDKSEVQCND